MNVASRRDSFNIYFMIINKGEIRALHFNLKYAVRAVGLASERDVSHCENDLISERGEMVLSRRCARARM